MKLSTVRVKQIIREEILKELSPTFDPGLHTQTMTSAQAKDKEKRKTDVAAEQMKRAADSLRMSVEDYREIRSLTYKGEKFSYKRIKAMRDRGLSPETIKNLSDQRKDKKPQKKQAAAVIDNKKDEKPSTVTPTATQKKKKSTLSMSGRDKLKEIQKIVGVEPDGKWGTETTKAWVRWAGGKLDKLGGDWIDPAKRKSMVGGWQSSGARNASELAGKTFTNDISGLYEFAKYLRSKTVARGAPTKAKSRVKTAVDKSKERRSKRQTKRSERRAKKKEAKRGFRFSRNESKTHRVMYDGSHINKLSLGFSKGKGVYEITPETLDQVRSVRLNGTKQAGQRKRDLIDFLKNQPQSSLDIMFND